MDVRERLYELDNVLFDLLKNIDEQLLNKKTALKNHTVKELLNNFYSLTLMDLANKVTLKDHVFAFADDFTINNLQNILTIQNRYFDSLNLAEKAKCKVSWLSFDDIMNDQYIASVYAERWFLQQLIRNALNKPILTGENFYIPYLDIVLQALPKAYSSVKTFVGASVQLQIVSENIKFVNLIKTALKWEVLEEGLQNPTSTIYINNQVVWMVFGGVIEPTEVREFIQLQGDMELAAYIFNVQAPVIKDI